MWGEKHEGGAGGEFGEDPIGDERWVREREYNTDSEVRVIQTGDLVHRSPGEVDINLNVKRKLVTPNR